MTASVDLPPGVLVAPKGGRCARCGEQYTAGTHARRYGAGLRPVACGCHDVADRPQTAPAQPVEPAAAAPEVVARDVADALSDAAAEAAWLTARRNLAAELGWPRPDDPWDIPEWQPLLTQCVVLVAERDDLAGQHADLTAEVDGLRSSLTTMRGRVHHLESELAKVGDERAAAVHRVAALEAQLAERPAAPRPPTPAAVPPRRQSEPTTKRGGLHLMSPHVTVRDDAFRDLSSTPPTHVCATPGCGHRDRFHDSDGCDRDGCVCTAYTTEGH